MSNYYMSEMLTRWASIIRQKAEDYEKGYKKGRTQPDLWDIANEMHAFEMGYYESVEQKKNIIINNSSK